MFLSCQPAKQKITILPNRNELNLKAFSIVLPEGWAYIKADGIDSFVGNIVGPKVSLSFDFSTMGYANDLLQTDEEYLKQGKWLRECYFCEPGIIYISGGSLKQAKADEMKRRGITDSSLVKVEIDPNPEIKKNIRKPSKQERIKYPNADYIADLTYRGIKKSIPIELPAEIKAHQTTIDTNNNYIVKTIWPKVPGKGMTGVYMKSRKSSLNFQISGDSLPKAQQELALQAFKTIKIKE